MGTWLSAVLERNKREFVYAVGKSRAKNALSQIAWRACVTMLGTGSFSSVQSEKSITSSVMTSVQDPQGDELFSPRFQTGIALKS